LISEKTQSDHETITAAGWAYRGNSRGWLIYKNPRTGVWHTRTQALRIVEARTDLLQFRLVSDLEMKEGACLGCELRAARHARSAASRA